MSDSNSTRLAKSPLELTVRAVVLGLILSVLMGAANVYVGLKAGMTVSASIPAAVMAMLLFRFFFRRSSILEANQVQTCASAGESLAAGIIFTMPALVMIGFWETFDFWTVQLVAMTGGLLGILFMIPMRRVFVVDNKELPYPEGVACAAVLEAGEGSGSQKSAAVGLIIGGMIGAIFKIANGFFGVVSSNLETAHVFNSRLFFIGGDLSPMLVAVGFIVRLNVAILIFIGGSIAWLIGIPIISGQMEITGDPVDAAYDIWSSQIRYVGVGAMVMGGIASLFSVRHGLLAAVRELSDGFQRPRTDSPLSQRDLNPKLIALLAIACIALLAGINYKFTGAVGITIITTATMVLLGFFFTAVASYIVGLVGNSNSPVSGMTITAVLAAGALLWVLNYEGTEAMVATLGVAAVVCCVACTAGDVCNDLKTGSLVGATPFRQQLMQIGGVIIASFFMAPVLWLLDQGTEGGIGGPELSAPQASLFASLARGFAGTEELPWHMIGIGAGVGILILVIDNILRVNGSKFRAHLMPIAVGMYLPFGLSIPILLGGIIAYIYSRGSTAKEADRKLHRGMLFSSGVIAGEALTAVVLALLAVGEGQKIPGIRAKIDLGLPPSILLTISAFAAIAAVVSFFVMARPANSQDED